MAAKRHDCHRLRPLLSLRVTDDLTVDEAVLVDQQVRECPHCKSLLESLSRAVSILRETGAEALPIADRPSLWDRIEPRLGPAGRMRRRSFWWLSTRQLVAACIALVGFTMYWEFPRNSQPGEASQTPPLAVRMVGDGTRLPKVGLTLELVDTSLRNLPSRALVVRAIRPDSPAARCCLKTFDVVIAVDGRRILHPKELSEAFSRRDFEGEMEIIRDGQWMLIRNGQAIPIVPSRQP